MIWVLHYCIKPLLCWLKRVFYISDLDDVDVNIVEIFVFYIDFILNRCIIFHSHFLDFPNPNLLYQSTPTRSLVPIWLYFTILPILSLWIIRPLRSLTMRKIFTFFHFLKSFVDPWCLVLLHGLFHSILDLDLHTHTTLYLHTLTLVKDD